MLDRQGVINIDNVKYSLDLFDKGIPYPFVRVKGGVNRYNEIIYRSSEERGERDDKGLQAT